MPAVGLVNADARDFAALERLGKSKYSGAPHARRFATYRLRISIWIGLGAASEQALVPSR